MPTDSKSNSPYKVLIVASHPVQYAAPIFRRIAQHPQVDLQVAYCSLQGVESTLDQEFGVEFAWDIPLLDGYHWTQLTNKSKRPGLYHFFGLNNPELWQLVRRNHFDAVIVLTGYIYWSFWITLLAAKVSRTPILYGTDSHGLLSRDRKAWKSWLKPWIWSFLFRLADMVIMPSTGGIALMRSLGIPESQLALTPYVVDNDWWKAEASRVDRTAIRHQWGVPQDAVVALFCAKLQDWKRPQDALQAFAKAKVAGSYLIFAGEGPLRQTLEAGALALGVAEQVRFLGFQNQSQLPAVYSASDLFVFPSEYEPFGVVVNEAMLCGCPVVVSDAVGARYDLVRQGETGFIYPCGDLESLTQIFQESLSDAERLKTMGVKAIQRMETWSPNESVEAVVNAIARTKQPPSLSTLTA
jgi:glycosyltransferase involved in cell wall biosynthesis